MAAEGQSDKTTTDTEVHMKQQCVTEFLYAGKIALIDIHHLLKANGDHRVDVSIVRRWVLHVSRVMKLHVTLWMCTAVTQQNEEHLDQLIHTKQ